MLKKRKRNDRKNNQRDSHKTEHWMRNTQQEKHLKSKQNSSCKIEKQALQQIIATWTEKLFISNWLEDTLYKEWLTEWILHTLYLIIIRVISVIFAVTHLGVTWKCYVGWVTNRLWAYWGQTLHHTIGQAYQRSKPSREMDPTWMEHQQCFLKLSFGKQAPTQKWCLKPELYSFTLRVYLNCGDRGTFGVLRRAQHRPPGAVWVYRCMSLQGVSGALEKQE